MQAAVSDLWRSWLYARAQSKAELCQDCCLQKTRDAPTAHLQAPILQPMCKKENGSFFLVTKPTLQYVDFVNVGFDSDLK